MVPTSIVVAESLNVSVLFDVGAAFLYLRSAGSSSEAADGDRAAAG